MDDLQRSIRAETVKRLAAEIALKQEKIHTILAEMYPMGSTVLCVLRHCQMHATAMEVVGYITGRHPGVRARMVKAKPKYDGDMYYRDISLANIVGHRTAKEA